MNYGHAFHAGNFADIVKHNVLLQLLLYLQKKPAPYCFIDTHAGEGAYSWAQLGTQKTGEALEGIYRLQKTTLPAPAQIQPYLNLLKDAPNFPGSAMIAAQLARETDRTILNEMHAETYQLLKQKMHAYHNVTIHQRNAYELLPAIVPPLARRGLVLMDPAFEDTNEMQLIKDCLQKCIKRWPQGMYCIWLPIVGRRYYTARDLMHVGFESSLTIEFYVKDIKTTPGLAGCTLLIINPPWQIEEILNPILKYLWEVLHIDPQSRWKISKS